MWLLVAHALAAPLRITPSPEATVEVLAVIDPGRVEVLVHKNTENLRAQLGTAPLDGIRAWRLSDLGGEWLLTAWLDDPTATLVMTPDKGTWTASTEPVGQVAMIDAEQACDATPHTALTPLHGKDMLHTFPADQFRPRMPRWSEAEVPEANWERVWTLRGNLDRTSARAFYALGSMHRDLGHMREAAYYFGEAGKLGVPDGLALLQRASALLAVGQWEAARATAAEARAAGAEEEHVLEIEGYVSLVTGTTDQAAAGRALAAVSTRAAPSLVAGALLLRAGCANEAETALMRAGQETDASRYAMAHLLLVDARLHGGDLRGAEEAIGDVSALRIPARWVPLLRARARLLTLLRQSPDAWAGMIPTLEAVSRKPDDEGTEALWLLGQMGQLLGDSRLVLDSWGELVDRHRDFLAGEPGARLAGAWTARVRTLLAEDRELDALAMHAGVWRAGLLQHLTDPTPLRQLGEIDERYGLYEPALDMMRATAQVEGQQGLDDRTTLLTIARLYRRSARPDEAGETLDFLATRPADPVFGARAALLRAALLEDAGNLDGARSLYDTITAPPAEAMEARLRQAMLNSHTDHCAEAIPVFASKPDPLPATISPAQLADDEARCLANLERPTEAEAAAAQAVSALADADAAAFAARLAASPPSAKPRTDIWSRLREEDLAYAALKARLAGPAPENAKLPPAPTDGGVGAPTP